MASPNPSEAGLQLFSIYASEMQMSIFQSLCVCEQKSLKDYMKLTWLEQAPGFIYEKECWKKWSCQFLGTT